MTTTPRFTSADLEALPLEDGKRYEIIDGELYVSKQPHVNHQRLCHRIAVKLQEWINTSGEGEVIPAPGVIFGADDDVAPDLVWMSSRRFAAVVGADGKLHAAPELIVEILSPGVANEKRDREAKLTLYSRRGVDEYWIMDWQRRGVEVFRREGARLVLSARLAESDTLTSPVLTGFSCLIANLFAGMRQKTSRR